MTEKSCCEGVIVHIQPVAVDQAQLPAAAVVFEAAEGLEGAVLVVVVLPAGEHGPLRHQRPDDREIVLLDDVVFVAISECAAGGIKAPSICTIAIANVDHLARIDFGLVVEDGATGLSTTGVGVPIEVGVDAPVAVETVLAGKGVGRAPAVIVQAAGI